MSNETDRTMAITTAAVLACICTLLLLFVGNMPIWALSMLLGFVAIMLVLRSQLCVYTALAVVLWGRFVADRSAGTGDFFTLSDLFVALVVLGLLASAFRYLELTSRRLDRHTAPDDLSTPHSLALVARLRPLGGLMLVMPAAVILAVVLLWYFPLDGAWPNSFGWPATIVRMLCVVWAFAIVFVVVSTALDELNWRRLRPNQAAVFIRRMLDEELGKDLSRIERRRARRFKQP